MSDERFLVSARKYRPQLFHELIAQEHVTETLKNALRLDRLAHAYLFTGPRGVGKTTAARILAKAINCTAAPEDRKDRTEPCRACDSCRSFEEGRNLNIFEIDAASNNSVNDARDLRETVRIPPQGALRKVYIIDEVHMLSAAAFNALLKTLEEPPAHALFIFATTEPHKVLATIQSRCQRFDFRRIPLQDIVSRLEAICQSESIESDDGSLMLVARKGDGALRDALSVFDQAVSLCGTKLEHAALVEALGVVSEDLFFEVTQCIAAGDRAGTLQLVERIVHAGYDLQEFLDGLAEHLRNLLVAVTLNDASLIEAAATTQKRYLDDAAGFAESQLLRLLSIVDRTEDLLRASRQPRLRLELSLLKMASLPDILDLREAIARLDRLEAGLPAEPAPPASVTPRVASPARPQPAPEPAAKPSAVPKPPVPSAPPVPAVQASASKPASKPVPEPAPKPAIAMAPEPVEPKLPDPDPVPDPGPIPDPAQESLFEPPAPRPSRSASYTPALGTPALESVSREAPAPIRPNDEGGVALAVAPVAVSARPSHWDAFLSRAKAGKIHLGALLQHAQPDVPAAGVIRLSVPDAFHVRVLREEEKWLLSELGHASGTEWHELRFAVATPAGDGSDDADAPFDPQAAVHALCEEYPALKLLMERFGGEIVW